MMDRQDVYLGQKVLYMPSAVGQRRFAGTVASMPWQMCSGVWVMKLCDMENGYGKYTGKKGLKANVVFAATLNACEPNGDTATQDAA